MGIRMIWRGGLNSQVIGEKERIGERKSRKNKNEGRLVRRSAENGIVLNGKVVEEFVCRICKWQRERNESAVEIKHRLFPPTPTLPSS